MPHIQEPMLAQDYDPELHDKMFPMYATPKVDGIRAYVDAGTVWARSNKSVPNRWIQNMLPLYLPSGIDVELGVGSHSAQDHFQKTTSVVMSDCNGIDDLHVYILDYVQEDGHEIRHYAERITYINRWWKQTAVLPQNQVFKTERLPLPDTFDAKRLIQQTTVLMPVKLTSPTQVPLFLNQCIKLGYEGAVLRRPDGGYEFGRPKAKDGLLLRCKPLEHSEAVIYGFKELEHNDNVQTLSPTGKATRSTHQSGKRLGGCLGAFLVRDLRTGIEFSVGGGTGLTHQLRQQVWASRQDFLGRVIRYSFLSVGTKHRPRQPKFTGFRDERDMS
jgi:DNA ligase 1